MIYENATKAIFNHLHGSGSMPTIYYPNIDGEPNEDHIIVSILFGNTNTVGLNSTNQNKGIINVLVRVETGKGQIRAMQIADDVLALFQRNTVLTSNDVTVRIDLQGYVSPPLPNNGWYTVPVSIPYNIIF